MATKEQYMRSSEKQENPSSNMFERKPSAQDKIAQYDYSL